MNTQNAKGQLRGPEFDIFDGQVGDWQFVDGVDEKDMWIYIWIPDGTPRGDLARLPIKPHAAWQRNGAYWNWDGNREAPTLTPSILHNRDKWHGYMTKGELVSV